MNNVKNVFPYIDIVYSGNEVRFSTYVRKKFGDTYWLIYCYFPFEVNSQLDMVQAFRQVMLECTKVLLFYKEPKEPFFYNGRCLAQPDPSQISEEERLIPHRKHE